MAPGRRVARRVPAELVTTRAGYPNVGLATIDLLERHGVEASDPKAQTCCGQLKASSGLGDAARPLAPAVPPDRRPLRVMHVAEILAEVAAG